MMKANEDEGGIASAGICLVAGVGNLTIKECTNNGKIVSNNVYSSGIANALINGDLDIQNCINYGIVEGYGERTIVAGVFIHSGMHSYEVCESNAIIKECVNEGIVKSSGADRNSIWYDETRIGGVCIIAAMSVDMQNCENNGTIESSSYYTAGLGFCFARESNISNCQNNKDIMINEDLPVVSGLIISSMQAETNASDVMTCNNLENNGKIIANLKEGSDKVQVGYVAGCVVTLNDNIDYIASKLIMNNCINNGDIDLRNAKYNESMKVDGIAIPNGHPIVEKSECVNNANILTPTN